MCTGGVPAGSGTPSTQAKRSAVRRLLPQARELCTVQTVQYCVVTMRYGALQCTISCGCREPAMQVPPGASSLGDTRSPLDSSRSALRSLIVLCLLKICLGSPQCTWHRVVVFFSFPLLLGTVQLQEPILHRGHVPVVLQPPDKARGGAASRALWGCV